MPYIPSTTIKSRYLKQFEVGTIFRDPVNDYSYEIIEKQFNCSMIKCAVPYLGKEDPIELKDVPLELIKQQNPKRANIMSMMKS